MRRPSFAQGRLSNAHSLFRLDHKLRRNTLGEVRHRQIPPVFHPDYVADWRPPQPAHILLSPTQILLARARFLRYFLPCFSTRTTTAPGRRWPALGGDLTMARRAGGRQARHAQRSAPLEEAMKPVRPGERGGRYHPFTDQDLEAIVENIYRILEEWFPRTSTKKSHDHRHQTNTQTSASEAKATDYQ